MRTDGIRQLFQTIARTIGAARFIEREAEPRIRRAVSQKFDELARAADETQESLTRQLHEGKTENGQRRRVKPDATR